MWECHSESSSEESQRRFLADIAEILPPSGRQNDALLLLEIAACGLFALDGFKECFEIAFAEAAAAFALNDFVEERGAVFYRASEDLQHVAFVVAIDEDAELFEFLDGLVNFADASFEFRVVGVRYFQEFNALLLQLGDCVQDVVRS